MQDLHLLMLTMLIDLNESIKNKDLIKKSQGTNWVKRKQLRTGSRFFHRLTTVPSLTEDYRLNSMMIKRAYDRVKKAAKSKVGRTLTTQ